MNANDHSSFLVLLNFTKLHHTILYHTVSYYIILHFSKLLLYQIMICFTIPDHISYTMTYHTILYLVYTILPSITENHVHEAGYFHAISRGSKLTVNLVQLSEPGQSADGMEPVIQAMNEIKSFQPDVILLYTKNKYIGPFVQQVIAVHYNSRFYLYVD